MREQEITITKSDLEAIVERAVNERFKEGAPKKKRPSNIFKGVFIKPEHFQEINQKYHQIIGLESKGYCKLGHPVTLEKYPHGIYNAERYKVLAVEIHDHLRKLTLSTFGKSLNSDLKESEYDQAADFYEALRDFYLKLYEERIKGLSIDDFER